MPAHASASDAVSRAKSDGKLLSTAEWRANDLADRLAKKGAASTPLCEASDAVIKAAGNALLRSAARLGVVTLEANCHRTEFLNKDGEVEIRFSRDSTPMPAALAKEKRAKADSKMSAGPPASAPPKPAPATVAPLAAPTRTQQRQQARRSYAAAAAVAYAAQTASAVASATASSLPPPISASERLAALRRRCGI